MMRKLILAFILSAPSVMALAQPAKGFTIIENKDKKQVDVLYNDKLLTAYCYYDSSRKPFLFPVNTLDGITVTRGYPFQPVPGDRTDHPHHTGIWLNYESVNGFDFWNNSTAIAPNKREHYGTIVHQQLIEKIVTRDTASIKIVAQWVNPSGQALLKEQSEFIFRVDENNFIIDRITKLTAVDKAVLFKDVKDGMFAIRVARELELPSKEASDYIDDNGNITKVPASGKEVTGMYYSSTGLKGDDVWGTKGKWAMLAGKKQDKDISIAIFDHPANIGYPAYWHARGYGLFSINPLGRKVFSKGTEELNFSLAPKQSAVFRYRIVIHSGSVLTGEQLGKLSEDFEKIK